MTHFRRLALLRLLCATVIKLRKTPQYKRALITLSISNLKLSPISSSLFYHRIMCSYQILILRDIFIMATYKNFQSSYKNIANNAIIRH